MRVGVVADTHVGEFLDALPASVARALEGCDLILHAGDLSVPRVLDELGAVAPVVAVRGDHDRLGGLDLPRSAVVTVAGRRIGLTHGRRLFAIDAAVIAAHVAAGRRIRWRAGLHPALLRRVGPVDCLVYGHWHEPVVAEVAGTLVFSPGAVCPWGSMEGGRPPRRGAAGVADRAVRRYRMQLGRDAMRPSVGILEVSPEGITPRVVPLDPA
ncbi:MAG: metallophosphoesterase family protein [Actinomycetota bacterium]